MTDDEKINIIIDSLKSHALADIKRASDGKSKLGAFILCSCLIDAMAGFLKGSDTNCNDYKRFVRQYLPDFNSDALYHDLRCKLVHSYSEGGSYLFTDANPLVHLRPSDTKLCINLENFIADIEGALEQLSTKLRNPMEVNLRRKAISRFDSNGIIQVFTSRVPIVGLPVSGNVY